ncbi:Glycerol-3-phosphate dehydrogenase [NAD(P)+] [Symmachiella dynata]|uniref:Glycerol-3-phosphate dehydrogenase [NAD(P)+] n=1 Tax=Symmachiella dynata TaxID=2527995 RepID=A0A517ZNZ0_9PLAN|nr:NAD(P)H-dependent glycerol-3-phosphate dehydrogenase [Symmachiella dynata]QDU44194.1 Glycerol-3-phosphate dehydrogenase [NAD(P)+] [Symmachiella dynata]
MGNKVTVLGGGAMGTACAILLSENPEQEVALWTRNPEHAAVMAQSRQNERLLPGVKIPASVAITADVEAAIDGADILVAAVPTAFLREALTDWAPLLTADRPMVSVIKGIENETFLRPSEIISEILGQRGVVALGGPSHAEEISRRLPASVVAASGDLSLAKRVQAMFTTDRFRVYTNVDIIGVEMAAALKNIVAIAAGICDGLGFGDNAKAGLITRGLVEMTRFGTAMGAEASTFSGLAGLGDLVTTCVSPYGRNREVGERLGKGETLEQIQADMKSVAEGVWTTRSVYELSDQRDVDMPIANEVYQVLFEGKSPTAATESLMLRPPKRE